MHSVLVGDFVYSKAFQNMSSLKNPEIIKVLANSTNMISEGEVMQLSLKASFLSEKDYFQIISNKTAELFKASAVSAALLSNASAEELKFVKHLAFSLGIIFQINDDILDYFGDEKEALSGCGRCDVCLALDNNDGADPEEVSIIVRKALCAVARIHGRFGLQTAVKLLRGAADARLLRAGLDQTPTYGVLQDRSEEWLVKLLRRCVAAGWVDFYGGARPVVVLTEEGHQVIHAKRAARLLLPSTVPKTSPTTLPGVGKRRVVAADQEMLDNAALDLFDALRRYRLEAARHESVPPYVIASDRTLRAIAVARPQDMNALEQIHGIGPTKAARYGAGLLKIVTRLDAD